ncbi:MAG: hypothetical protein WAL45_18970 [Terracidiphilus sp.]
MFCSVKSPAQRRFVSTSLMSALLVVVLALVAAAAFRLGHLKGLLAYPVAILPALPILWVLIETGRFLAVEKDEFQRNLLVQCPARGYRRHFSNNDDLWLHAGLCSRAAARPGLDLPDLLALCSHCHTRGEGEVQMRAATISDRQFDIFHLQRNPL